MANNATAKRIEELWCSSSDITPRDIARITGVSLKSVNEVIESM